MEMKEFAEIVKKKLAEQTGREVRVVEVKKNNGLVLHGVIITETESNLMPTIYLESYLADYEESNGNKGLEEIIEQIKKLWESNRVRTNVDIDFFPDFERVKAKLAYKLVNYELNKDLLAEIPHEKFMDLAKIYYIEIENRSLGKGTVTIKNEYLGIWGITKERLCSVAEENMQRRFPMEIKTIEDVIEEITWGSAKNVEENKEIESKSNLYVASNRSRIYGAAVMCYVDKLKEFAEQKKGDLVIFPCSIHEILIMVWNETMEDIKYFKEMVHEINSSNVDVDDILSNSVYFYDRKTNTISVA